MARFKKRQGGPTRQGRGTDANDARRADSGSIGMRRVEGLPDTWVLVPPRCAGERREDLEEVDQMIAAGEFEIARDELRWLLEGCDACLAAHRLLGQLALEEDDWPLARGHFGYAYELGCRAVERLGNAAHLPYAQADNQPLLESAKGLAFALLELGRGGLAVEVLERLLRWDPSDPLGARQLLDRAIHRPG